MKNRNVKRKTMGQFQNKLFDTESSILNDPKGEIYIGKIVKKTKSKIEIIKVSPGDTF